MDYQREFLLRQIEFVREERLRRSSQQWEYVRISMINNGVITLFGVTGIIYENSNTIDQNQLFVLFLIMLVGFYFISFILYLLWYDDAITIGGIDNFIRSKEEEIQNDESPFWHGYRDKFLNSKRSFRRKKLAFNLAIPLAFSSPVVMVIIFYFGFQMDHLPGWTVVLIIILLCSLFIVPILGWRSDNKKYG